MNTTAKGAEFEKRVYDYLKSLLEKDELPQANKKYSQIFLHRKYTTDTSRIIDFDITIETYNPLSKDKRWTSLVVIECKNYNGKVDTGDFDEFETKLHKVSDSGVKGIFVTTKGFTYSQIETARKNHISLVVMNDNQPEWIVSRDVNTKSQDKMLLLKGEKEVGFVPVVYSDGLFGNIVNLLSSFGCCINEKAIINAPFLKREDIERVVDEINEKYVFSTNDIAGELLCKAFPEYKITFDDMPTGTLGHISFDDSVITLSNGILEDEHRRNFTLAHELGHLYLHKELMQRYIKTHMDYEERYSKELPDQIIQRLEIQANLFASFLLLPKERFYSSLLLLFKKYSITTYRLYLDHQLCNIRDVNNIIGALSKEFNVSKEMVKMRLLNEKLLKVAQ